MARKYRAGGGDGVSHDFSGWAAALGAVFFGAMLFGPSSAEAQRRGGDEIFIACPGPRLDVGLTAQGLDGWRGPNARAQLVDAKVAQTRRGLRLECGYRMFGEVVYFRRPAPEQAADCRAIRDGFVCQSPRRGGPVDGQFQLRADRTVDLDAGLRGAGAPDLLLQRRGALRRALNPLGEAQIARVGGEEPRRRDCVAARYSSRRIDVASLRRGEWLCVLTSANRYARLRLVERRINLGGPVRLRFDYRVWRKRGP